MPTEMFAEIQLILHMAFSRISRRKFHMLNFGKGSLIFLKRMAMQ